jgi:hypothetical protein
MARNNQAIGDALRAKSSRAAEINQLADTANGHKATRAQREAAAAELKAQLGRRGAAKAVESSLLRAGAKPKGLRGWLS